MLPIDGILDFPVILKQMILSYQQIAESVNGDFGWTSKMLLLRNITGDKNMDKRCREIRKGNSICLVVWYTDNHAYSNFMITVPRNIGVHLYLAAENKSIINLTLHEINIILSRIETIHQRIQKPIGNFTGSILGFF